MSSLQRGFLGRGRSWEGCLELSLLRVEDARRSYSGDGLGVEMAPVKRCSGRRIWIARYGQLGSTGKGDVLQRKPVHLPNNRLSVKAKFKKTCDCCFLRRLRVCCAAKGHYSGGGCGRVCAQLWKEGNSFSSRWVGGGFSVGHLPSRVLGSCPDFLVRQRLRDGMTSSVCGPICPGPRGSSTSDFARSVAQPSLEAYRARQLTDPVLPMSGRTSWQRLCRGLKSFFMIVPSGGSPPWVLVP